MKNAGWAFAAVVFLLLGASYNLAVAQPVPVPGKCSATNLQSCPSPNYNAPNINSLSANVLAFGADPKGVNDSTTAISNAIATGRDVYLPAGTYLVSNSLNLTNGQCFRGAGRGATTLSVPTSFSPSASGVITLTGREQLSPCVRDLAIVFQQPPAFSTTASASSASGQASLTVANGAGSANGYYVYDTTNTAAIFPPAVITSGGGSNSWTLSANLASKVSSGDTILFIAPRSAATHLGSCVTGSLCEFPPGIYSGGPNEANRFRIDHVSFYDAWDCINAGSNAVGIGGYIIDNVECGAYDVGVYLQNGFSFGHMKSYEFSPYGILNVFQGIYYDAQTYAAKFNQIEGLAAEDYSVFNGKTYWDGNVSWGEFTNAQLDNGASFTVNTDSTPVGVLFNGGYYTSGGSTTAQRECGITAVAGAFVKVVHFYMSTAAYPAVCSGTGQMDLDDDIFFSQSPSASLVTATAGRLSVNNSILQTFGSQPWTVSPVAISSGAFLSFTNNTFWNAPNAGSSPAISIATDSVIDVVTGNDFFGWFFAPPGTSGTYAPNAHLISVPPDSAGTSLGLGTNALNGQPGGVQFFNTALGFDTLDGTMTTAAQYDTAVGAQSGKAITTGNHDTCVGENACLSVTTGVYDTAIGTSAMANNVSGSDNTILGVAAGQMVTGSNNTILGTLVASTTLTTGSTNILIGSSAAIDTPTSSTTNYLNVGNLLVGDTAKGILGIGDGTKAPTLASCGSGSPAVGTGSGNAHGTITEGTSATGCTITFRNAFATPPDCVVSSPSGLGSLTYTVSASALTVSNTNTSSGTISYVCIEGGLVP